MPGLQKFFTSTLLDWNRHQNTRQMPWKNESDPYRIWLSEIMLQQTRVEQGWNYYLKFLKHYPTVEALAAAKDEAVFKDWEGLGYYSRCRNLLATARHVAWELDGKFPESYEGLLKLKGVGEYTASAIASFAYHLPHAVVDGNVVRVLARYFNISKTAADSTGRKLFAAVAGELLPKEHAAEYNQAIMDFGATVCMPRLPLCASCPLKTNCIAFTENKVMDLPVKKVPLIRKDRFFGYFILLTGDSVLVRQRTDKDIWQGLHEFYLHEYADALDIREDFIPGEILELLGKGNIDQSVILRPQQLSHQTVHIRLRYIRLLAEKEVEGYWWVKFDALKELAFPRSLVKVASDLAGYPLSPLANMAAEP